MKYSGLSLVVGAGLFLSSCAQFNNAWTSAFPQFAETLPPPTSVAGATIEVQTESEGTIKIRMKNNNSGTVQTADQTGSVKYSVVDGRAHLYVAYTQLIRGGAKIYDYTLDNDPPRDTYVENSSPRSAYLTIQSVNGKEYYGVLNGYLHNGYEMTAERLSNVPVTIKLR